MYIYNLNIILLNILVGNVVKRKSNKIKTKIFPIKYLIEEKRYIEVEIVNPISQTNDVYIIKFGHSKTRL